MTDTRSGTLQSISYAFQGLLIGLVLVLVSLINLQIGYVNVGLSFVPVAALIFWPQKASYTWSLILIFLIGIFQDYMSYSPLGLRSFSYLVLFIVMDAGLKGRPTFEKAIGSYFLSMCFIFGVLMALGRFGLGAWPLWLSLVIDALASLFVFPAIYWMRVLGSAFISEPDKREIS